MAETAGIITQVDAPDAEPCSPRGPRSPRNFSPSASSSSPGSSMSTSLRRIFSPSVSTGAGKEDEDDDISPRPQRRGLFARLCACMAPHKEPQPASPASIADFQEQLANLEPTYEPEAPLLKDAEPHLAEKPCLVLDLDETLVHSSFTPIDGADFEIPLDMQGETHTVFVKKRPGVDNFLSTVSKSWETIIFTASLSLYADPVMQLLDPKDLCNGRLYREHCVLIGNCYVKDIAKLGRDLKRTLIVDNSPLSYALQPENAIPIESFFTDDSDRELDNLLVFLEEARNLSDLRNSFQNFEAAQ